ncbi:transglycosylase domain-containing protein [Pseudonocardia sichuanensis]
MPGPYGGPPPQGRPPRRPAPPPDSRVPPQRYRADGPPVSSGARQSAYQGGDVPLLTHDEDSGPTAVVGGPAPGGAAVAQHPAPRSETRRGRTSGKAASPWRRVRRIFYVMLGAALIGPFAAFVVGWLIFPVPTAEQAALTQVATFTFADGQTPIATVRPENGNRVLVTLDKVPEHVREAVLSAEDRSFYSNPGFDLVGIGRAVYNQLTGGSGGGSTVTQQYVKVSTGQDDFSLWRKYKEVILAVKITREQTKDEILENYLNTIYWGRGASGIQAAAQAYFGKNVEDLTISEGAMLAGTIQSPSRWDPAKNPERSQERWAFVLDGMVEQRWITPEERAQQTFPTSWLPEAPAGGGVPDDDRYHIYDRAVEELAAKGITQEQIDTEGLTVTTTVEEPRQKQAVDAVKEKMERQPDNLRSALVSIDPRNGAILAYYGGQNGLGTDYAMALRQPGSSFKPFVLSAALQSGKGIGLGTEYTGTSPMEFPGRAGAVSNVEGVDCERCNAIEAMTNSINTWFYQLGIEVGPQSVAQAAHQAGIPDDLLPDPTGGIALGDKEVHPVDMASAYATFAAEGVHHEPYIVSRVQAADGRVLYEREDPAGRQAVPPQVARNVVEAMLDVASHTDHALSDGREVAGKTGTVQLQGKDNKDAWMVGFTPSISTAVWVGSDQSDALRNAQQRPIYGSGLPSDIWQEFMNAALRGEPKETFGPFEPIGEAPSAAPPVSSTQSPDDEEDEDEESSDGDSDSDSSSDSDSDSDRDSSRSSRDSGDSSDEDRSGSSSDSSSPFGGSSDGGSGDGGGSSSSSDDRPTSNSRQDQSRTVPAGATDTSDSGPVG